MKIKKMMVSFTMLLLIVFMIFLINSVSAEDYDVDADGGGLGWADPGEWVSGYENYDALAGWLFGGKDEETEKDKDRMREKFCKAMGAPVMKDCAIATMCASELYDFEDIDGVVVGRTASGEFISVMHAEGWRTPGMVFINETTGEVFTEARRYLYKVTWSVNMARLAEPGAGVLTKVTGPVNGYNVYFQYNEEVKYTYFDEDWYMLNASETHGLTEANPFIRYSNNEYNKICLWLQTPIDVSLGIGLGSTSYQYICNDIVEHTGDPTLLEQAGGGTPPPGVSGGF